MVFTFVTGFVTSSTGENSYIPDQPCGKWHAAICSVVTTCDIASHFSCHCTTFGYPVETISERFLLAVWKNSLIDLMDHVFSLYE